MSDHGESTSSGGYSIVPLLGNLTLIGPRVGISARGFGEEKKVRKRRTTKKSVDTDNLFSV